MSGIASDILFVFGCLLLTAGLACIWWPLSLISGGLFLIGGAYVLHLRELAHVRKKG